MIKIATTATAIHGLVLVFFFSEFNTNTIKTIDRIVCLATRIFRFGSFGTVLASSDTVLCGCHITCPKGNAQNWRKLTKRISRFAFVAQQHSNTATQQHSNTATPLTVVASVVISLGRCHTVREFSSSVWLEPFSLVSQVSWGSIAPIMPSTNIPNVSFSLLL
jgi:hypothetical protein